MHASQSPCLVRDVPYPADPCNAGLAARTLDPIASCHARHQLTHLLPGHLGLHLRSDNTHTTTLAPSSLHTSVPSLANQVTGSVFGTLSSPLQGTLGNSGTQGTSVVGIAADGAVCSVVVAEPHSNLSSSPNSNSNQGSDANSDVHMAAEPLIDDSLAGTGAGTNGVLALKALQYELDGRQGELGLGLSVSASHRAGWSLCVSGSAGLASIWQGGLGEAEKPLPQHAVDGEWVRAGLGAQGGVPMDADTLASVLTRLAL